ncbi:glutathione S-transferase N-terminal domain-containing protein, partial [Alphaproteobacteria bacterium]|nr:glutathione S-transferase N-terminal domain-containing protein [Alphaproteobacteria bacterium]
QKKTGESQKYKLFTVEHSYFSGKIRAYLRWKHYHGALGDGFEDILATPELLEKLIMPKSGVPSLPQIEAPDGTWLQDSSIIFDHIEAQHPQVPAVADAKNAPRQCLASYLIELLADEWLIVPACRARWHFSRSSVSPSHLTFNEQQWGAWLAPDGTGTAKLVPVSLRPVSAFRKPIATRRKARLRA